MYTINFLKSSQFFSLNSNVKAISKSGVQALLSTSAPNFDFKTANRDDINDSLLFPENKHNRNEQADKISKAMVYYLEKLNEREEIMKVKTEEFQIGKRHLARMMGENPETFSQEKIDEAISYLLPSGLFEPKARPFLKDPKTYFPNSKISMFNKDGRPLSHLYYTGQPELYQLTYDTTQKLINLKKLEDAMLLLMEKIKGHENNEASTKIDLSGTVWIDREALSKRLSKNIDENDFSKFLKLLKKLTDHSMSMKEEPFIKQFLCPFVPPIKMSDIQEPYLDAKSGKRFVKTETHVRTAYCKLKLTEGTGVISIKSEEGLFDINYFETLTHRQQILFPFKVVDRMNKFDIDVEINKGGMSCLAKCIQYTVSTGLCSFVPAESIEKLRLAGLLTKDNRAKERKKYGKEGARRAYTWKKR